MNFDSNGASVSVVIPVYNREMSVERAIDSVVDQTSAIREIIVVDDGSRDRSAKVVQDYATRSPLIRFVQQSNAGAAAARNVGLRLATGRWIAFLDSDDLWRPTKIECALSMMTARPSLDFIHTAYVYDTGDVPPRPRDIKFQREDKATLLAGFGIKTSTVVFRRSLLLGSELFREDLRTCEDYEFFWRLVAVSREIGFAEQDLTVVAMSDNSLTKVTPTSQRLSDHVTAISSALGWIEGQSVSDAVLRQMRDHLYWSVVVLSRHYAKTGSYVDLLRSFKWMWRCLGPAKAFRGAISSLT